MKTFSDLKPKPRWWHPLFIQLSATPFGVWLMSGRLHKLDAPFLRLSKNRISLSSLLSGGMVIVLKTTGAKSGMPRTLPLLAVPDGEALILIASNYGNPGHPSWYYNLRAYPEVQILYGGESFNVTARLLEGQERERCWQKTVSMYPVYRLYEEKVGDRVIQVFLLEPAP